MSERKRESQKPCIKAAVLTFSSTGFSNYFYRIELGLSGKFFSAAKMRDKLTVLRGLVKSVSIARVRETRIRHLCNRFWMKKLKFLNREVLIRKFKFVLGNCNFSTIYAIFKKGLLSSEPECLKFACLCIRRRNLSIESSRVLEILEGNTFLQFFVSKILFAYS